MKAALIFSLVTSASAAAINARANPELTLGARPVPTSEIAAEGNQAIDPALTLGGTHPAPSSDLAADRKKKAINPALTLGGDRPAPTSDLAAERKKKAINPALTLGGDRPAPTSDLAAPGKKADSQSFPTVFTLRVVSDDENINNQNITAVKGKVQIYGEQDAFCSWSDPPSYAYFYLEDHKLMMYSDNVQQQQLYMFGGNGNIMYSNAYYEADPGEKIWFLDHDNQMTLGGDGFRLCKSSTETPFWWLSAQLYDRLTYDGDTAAHSDGYCTADFVLEAVRVEDPPSCRYN